MVAYCVYYDMPCGLRRPRRVDRALFMGTYSLHSGNGDNAKSDYGRKVRNTIPFRAVGLLGRMFCRREVHKTSGHYRRDLSTCGLHDVQNSRCRRSQVYILPSAPEAMHAKHDLGARHTRNITRLWPKGDSLLLNLKIAVEIPSCIILATKNRRKRRKVRI